jgi:LPXTG-motif cell wall-anchored protein
MPADHIIEAGNRIALALTGSNLVWAVPDEHRATLTVHLDATSVTLPVVEGARQVQGAPKPAPKPAPRKALPATGLGSGDAGAALVGGALVLVALARRRRGSQAQ